MSRNAFPQLEQEYNEREERLDEIRARTKPIPVPVSTVEKPITVIDYIAAMDQCQAFLQLTDYAGRVPPAIVEDERFAKAFKTRLDAIRKK